MLRRLLVVLALVVGVNSLRSAVCPWTSPDGDRYQFPLGETYFTDGFWHYYTNICGSPAPTCVSETEAACYFDTGENKITMGLTSSWSWSRLPLGGKGALMTIVGPMCTGNGQPGKVYIEYICSPVEGSRWVRELLGTCEFWFEIMSEKACPAKDDCGVFCNADDDCSDPCPVCNATHACAASLYECGILCEDDWDCDGECPICDNHLRCTKSCGSVCDSPTNCPSSCPVCNFRRNCVADVCGSPCNGNAQCGGSCPNCQDTICRA